MRAAVLLAASQARAAWRGGLAQRLPDCVLQGAHAGFEEDDKSAPRDPEAAWRENVALQRVTGSLTFNKSGWCSLLRSLPVPSSRRRGTRACRGTPGPAVGMLPLRARGIPALLLALVTMSQEGACFLPGPGAWTPQASLAPPRLCGAVRSRYCTRVAVLSMCVSHFLMCSRAVRWGSSLRRGCAHADRPLSYFA